MKNNVKNKILKLTIALFAVGSCVLGTNIVNCSTFANKPKKGTVSLNTYTKNKSNVKKHKTAGLRIDNHADDNQKALFAFDPLVMADDDKYLLNGATFVVKNNETGSVWKGFYPATEIHAFGDVSACVFFNTNREDAAEWTKMDDGFEFEEGTGYTVKVYEGDCLNIENLDEANLVATFENVIADKANELESRMVYDETSAAGFAVGNKSAFKEWRSEREGKLYGYFDHEMIASSSKTPLDKENTSNKSNGTALSSNKKAKPIAFKSNGIALSSNKKSKPIAFDPLVMADDDKYLLNGATSTVKEHGVKGTTFAVKEHGVKGTHFIMKSEE